MARASVAAQRRRARSSSTDSRLVYFVLMVWTVTFRMQTILPIEGENWISYSGETPKKQELRNTVPCCASQRRGEFPSRSPVGAPGTSSSDLPHRLWQLACGQFAVLTPAVQFPIAPRCFQRRQRQHPLRRPTHPLVLAPARDRPIVEFLHPRARNPQARPLPLLIIGEVGTAPRQILDQIRDRLGIPHPLQCPLQQVHRRVHRPLPQLTQRVALQRTQ